MSAGDVVFYERAECLVRAVTTDRFGVVWLRLSRRRRDGEWSTKTFGDRRADLCTPVEPGERA